MRAALFHTEHLLRSLLSWHTFACPFRIYIAASRVGCQFQGKKPIWGWKLTMFVQCLKLWCIAGLCNIQKDHEDQMVHISLQINLMTIYLSIYSLDATHSLKIPKPPNSQGKTIKPKTCTEFVEKIGQATSYNSYPLQRSL